jgi:CHAT domain
LNSAPKIEKRWACIAAVDQTILAAQLSSYFNEPGTYFPLFEFPKADRPYQEIPTRDGYFAQIIGKRAATHINNCLAQIQPESIILLGLTEIAQTYIRAIIPEHKLIIVNRESELLALPFASASETFKCKPSQAIEGLMAAKATKKPLAFSEDAPDLPSRLIRGKKGLVVLENPAEVGEVSIINYAASIDADIVLADEVERNELRSLPRDLQAWADDRSSPAFRDARKKITKRIQGIDFTSYDFATFFTAGLPYGLILKNVIPFTHVLNGPYCAVFITNAIIEEKLPCVGSALLFSTDEFASDETDDVAQRLDEANFVATLLRGKNATNNNLTNYGSYLPYDLMHICSHGGETDGYFVKHDFKDREGNAHTIEYFEVMSYSEEAAIDPNKVKVETKTIFTAFDGIPWTQRPLSIHPRYVGDDMMQAIRDDDHLKRTPVSAPIALSCHIKCYRSFHQGVFDNLAAHAHPIIFNNSCSSSHELADGFLGGGARCYIATLWNVGDETAMKAAVTFYESVIADGSVLNAFSTMLRSITEDEYRHIYILWGLHFSSFRHPAAKSDAQILAGLLDTYFMFARKFATTKDGEIKTNTYPIVRFLFSELTRRFTRERLEQVLGDKVIRDQKAIERSQSFDEHEIDEIVITKEIDPPEDKKSLN